MLVFCLALLSFAVGTFVGKNITEKELSQTHYYQQQQNDRATASAQTPDDSVTDNEVNELANEFVEAERKTASEHHEGYDQVESDDTELERDSASEDQNEEEANEK